MSSIASIFKNSGRRSPGSRAYLFPGQGSQRPGMGEGLFERHPELVARADAVLGYPVKEVCLEQPIRRLRLAEYLQPALYVVSALHYHDEAGRAELAGEYLAGHSLGQFAALYAADVFDFETGLEMVRIRGELSGQVRDGAMAAVLGLHWERAEAVLRESGFDRVQVANYNSPRQLVLTGAADQLERARASFEGIPGCRFVPLPIPGAFHSPSMKETAERFLERIKAFAFRRPRVPVLSCATGRPLPAERPESFAGLLADQLTQPVRWMETIQYLRAEGVTEFVEAGPGDVLRKLNGFILAELPAPPLHAAAGPRPPAAKPAPAGHAEPPGSSLGLAAFRDEYRCRFAYAVGGLEPGLATLDAALATARDGILTFYSPAGPGPDPVPAAIDALVRAGGAALPLGISLSQLHHPDLDPLLEHLTQGGIRNLELRDPVHPTPGMAAFRLGGGRILVRTGRLDVAQEFLVPFGRECLAALAPDPRLATMAPASDLVVRVDFTEPVDSQGSAVLLPLLLELRAGLLRSGVLATGPRIGLGEGLGTPRAIAGAFLQGAEFVMTVGVNGCGRDTRLAPRVKDLLQAAGPQDFVFAPDGHDLELGLRRPVLGRGVLFPGRAQYLFELSRSARRLGELDARTREQLERRLLKQPAEALLTRAGGVPGPGPGAELATLARFYLTTARAAAIEGREDWSPDYSVPGDCGLGAWNLHARGTELEAWRERTPERIAVHLMSHAGALLERAAS